MKVFFFLLLWRPQRLLYLNWEVEGFHNGWCSREMPKRTVNKLPICGLSNEKERENELGATGNSMKS